MPLYTINLPQPTSFLDAEELAKQRLQDSLPRRSTVQIKKMGSNPVIVAALVKKLVALVASK